MKTLMAAFLLSMNGWAVELYTTMPADIHPAERYVFFQHGAIAEGTDPRPVSPEFGVYDFPAIKQALFEKGGFNLIAQQRAKDANVEESAAMLESWVRKLLAAGVPASRISIVGFSRGSFITAFASARLKDTGIHTALLGACTKGDIAGKEAPAVLAGNLLSIYETSDVVLTCDVLAKRSKLTSFREIAISTGKKHGAFYLPRSEWMTPLKAWIQETNR